MDEIGGLPKALEIGKQKAGIRPEDKVELVEFPRKKSLLELLISRAQESELRLPLGVSKLLAQWKLIGSFPATLNLARMPFALEFRWSAYLWSRLGPDAVAELVRARPVDRVRRE